MRRVLFLASLALAGVAALVVIGGAGGAGAKKGKPTLSATPVFKALLKPSQEVDPEVTGLRANAVGNVTFDLTRDATGAITSGEIVFYFNYKFPGAVTINGLHVHEAKKGTNGPIRIDSDVGTVADTDGVGNVTTVQTASAAELAEIADILEKPRDYYVNLHTTANPAGAMRAQLHNPKKR